MDSENYKAIRIETRTEEQALALSERIHNQLMGNPDYVNNNILLNRDEPKCVRLWVFGDTQLPVLDLN